MASSDKVLRNLDYKYFEALENYDWSKRPGLNDEIDDEEIVKLFLYLQKLKKEYNNGEGHGSGLLRRDG